MANDTRGITMELVTTTIATPAPAPEATPEKWVNIAAVSKHIGFCPRLVTAWMKAGKLPCHPARNGKRVYYRFLLSEVDAAMKAGRLQ